MDNEHRLTFLDECTWDAIVTSLHLSDRESQVVRCLLRDEPESVIADELRISPHTVHSHLERLYRKLHARSRCQVVIRIFEAYVRNAERAVTLPSHCSPASQPPPEQPT